MCTSQKQRRRPRQVKSVAEGHTARQRQSKDWDSSPPAPKPRLLSEHSKSALSAHWLPVLSYQPALPHTAVPPGWSVKIYIRMQHTLTFRRGESQSSPSAWFISLNFNHHPKPLPLNYLSTLMTHNPF